VPIGSDEGIVSTRVFQPGFVIPIFRWFGFFRMGIEPLTVCGLGFLRHFAELLRQHIS